MEAYGLTQRGYAALRRYTIAGNDDLQGRKRPRPLPVLPAFACSEPFPGYQPTFHLHHSTLDEGEPWSRLDRQELPLSFIFSNPNG
jgi:hypothetical protein